MTFKWYISRRVAELACAKRSLFAYQNGECSQYEVRTNTGGSFIGGLSRELAEKFPTATVVAQYSGGYFVPLNVPV